MSREIVLIKKQEKESTIQDDFKYLSVLHSWAKRMERSVKNRKP